jgi:uncharacterized protein involved in response to NO
MAMIPLSEPAAAPATRAPAFALWDLGFRPFYLAASVFAALSVPLWVAQYAGWLPFAYVRSAAWHGSEMLLGYTLAVVAGFLFTAVRNWTGRPTPTGNALMALVSLWIAGRVLVATPFALTAALVDAAFPLAVALGIAIPLARAGNRRNYFFIGLLVLFAIAGLVLHLSSLAVLPWSEQPSLRIVLDLLLLVMALMGGRVIPMFTANGVPGTHPKRHAIVEKLALAGIVVLALADALQAPSAVLIALTAALAVVHGTRLALWQPWRVLRTPLVWILHAAYAWIVVHLALRALAAAGAVLESIATHALTVGAIGGLTIGMMTRTARGHTGRVLIADRADVACYVLITLAALARVVGGIALPGAYVATVAVAAVCWSAAFMVYAIAYAPRLLRTRIDGKPG